ncbi:MAG TPA: Maf family protein [Coriobacteriia bacterium]
MPAMDAPLDAPLLLASASPRRQRLLAWLGVPYDVTATDVDEDLTSPLRGVPPVLARSIAADKARAARASGPLPDAGAPAPDPPVIVACDTIVVLDRRVLGKPADLDDALAMLEALSGRSHDVITGVAIHLPAWDEPRTFAVTTPVRMHDLDEESVRAWADKGELLGCAGAYNIESHLASVDADQCYQNVAGLPLCHLYAELARYGVGGLHSPVEACNAARGVDCELGPRVVRRVPRER